MITKTGQVAKQIMSTGRGHYAFNDKLKDGRRSLKVVGWGYSDYTKAKDMLEQLGCVAEIIKTTTHRGTAFHGKRTCSVVRRHVTE